MNALGMLTGDDYALEFFFRTGRQPRWVPSAGDYYTGRRWIRWYGGEND